MTSPSTTLKSKEFEIGRPPIYSGRNGTEILLPVHDAFLKSQATRRLVAFHRRGRKTSTALEEVFKYAQSTPGIVCKTLAPKRKQAKEIIWTDPDMLFHKNVCPPQIIAKVNNSDLSITLKNGSIYYLDGADDPNHQRGGNVKVLHLTEMGDHKEAVWTQVFEPVLIANGGILIGEGNPRGKNWYHKLFMNAQGRKGWETFLLSARNSPIFTAEELDELERTLPYNVFASEYLCEWVDSIGIVFRTFRQVATAKMTEAQPGRKYRIAFDLAKIVDWTVGSVVDKHNWNQVRLERWNQIDWTLQKEKMKALIKTYAKKADGNATEVLIESNGVGDPIFDDIWTWAMSISEEYDIEVKPIRMTQDLKNLLVQNFSMLCDQNIIAILPDDTLMQELELFTYEKTLTGFRYTAPDGYHDDTVMASLISYWELGGKLPEPDTSPEQRSQWGFTPERMKKYNLAASNPHEVVI